MRDAIAHRGLYADSSEQLTPVLRDPASLLPAPFVAARLLLSPYHAAKIADRAVSGYSIGPTSVENRPPSSL
jgi:hypothetical protein